MNKTEAINRLKSILKPGDTIPVIIRSVSRSGMSRTMDFYGPDLSYLSGYIALACGYTRTRDGALRVKGCGMDMAFAVVYNLGRTLWPDGFGVAPLRSPVGQDIGPAVGNAIRPPSRGVAAEMFAAGWVFRGRIGEASGWDNDGGYALKHRVL